METIILRTKKELEIYMNPVRQEILHEMQRAGIPVTPKYLSNALGISCLLYTSDAADDLGAV